MRRYGSRAPDRRAFTLVELTIVILLIAILSASIIPEMRGTYQDALLRSTTRTLIDSFGIAYSRAVSLGQLHRVRIDVAGGEYRIERRDPSAGTDEFTPVKDIQGGSGKLDRRISIQIRKDPDSPSDDAAQSGSRTDSDRPAGPDSDNSISFYPDGTADAAELELRDRGGFRMGLRINPITARVHIEDLKRE